jgi:hypothetical protein
MTKFIEYLNEASLTGTSRSGGMSNWDYYVVKDFDKNKEYIFDTDTTLYTTNFEVVKKVNKNDKLYIISPKLIKKDRSDYAEILHKNEKYLVKISSIKKPTEIDKGVVIPGGVNSKEFTPDKFGFNGKEFTSINELTNITINKIDNIYTDTSYDTIKKYIRDCLTVISGQNLMLESKGYVKQYKIKNDYNISDRDIRILSKNFGEILASLFILKTNKKAKSIVFPSDISQQLYDFYIKTDKGNHFYSVKSLGGSSTSMENINFILKHFSQNNQFFDRYKHEVDIIMSLINNKEAGKTTIKNIGNFFTKLFSSKINDILRLLNRYVPKSSIRDLSQRSLTTWFSVMVETISLQEFTDLMNKVYNEILGDLPTVPKTSEKVLSDMYKVGDGSKFAHGYLYYPMGSYIINYLNIKGTYKFVLNELLNYGNFISQLEVNLSPSDITIKLVPFKKSNFRFTYNGMSKAPGNRPLGFKST